MSRSAVGGSPSWPVTTMGQSGFFTALPLLIGGACFTLALYPFLRRERVPGSLSFGLLFFAVAFYSGASGIEHSHTELGGILRWVKIEYLGALCMGPLWLVFALRFTGRRRLRSAELALLFLEPLVVLVSIWTPAGFAAFYPSVGTRIERGYTVFWALRGPLFWVHQTLTSVMYLAGVFVLALHARRSPAPKRANAHLALIASILPWAVNLLYMFDIPPARFDLGPYAIALSGGLFAWALFRRNLLDLVGAVRGRVLETMAEGLLIAETDGSLVDSNPAARRFLGSAAAERPDPSPLLEGPRHAELRTLLAAGEGELVLSNLGPAHDLELRAQAFTVLDRRSKPLGHAVSLTDITATSALVSRLQAQASLDPLTGAMNRRRFMELATRDLELAKRNLRPLGLVMMDLDHFKSVNDSQGHAAGDELLRVICGCCQEALRGTDLFCRFGGEEFALLLPGTDLEGAELVAERLRSRIASLAVAWDGESIGITASFGVCASLPAEDESLDLFLRSADAALYEAKAAGRNRVAAYRD